MALSPSKRILIVEDDGELLEVLKFVLEDAGYEVLNAADGTEALRLMQAEKVDLIVLDVTMAGMTGLDVARELRAREDTAQVRIALHTALQEKAVKAEFSDYDIFMPKGDNADELLRMIAHALTT